MKKSEHYDLLNTNSDIKRRGMWMWKNVDEKSGIAFLYLECKGLTPSHLSTL